MKHSLQNLKTWIEIDRNAICHNVKIFRSLVERNTKIMAVVKSNAYGHGLWVFSKIAEKAGVGGFCVDSVQEGLRLRKEGIKKPILVLGFTLQSLFENAEKGDITVSISSIAGLEALASFVGAPASTKLGQGKPTRQVQSKKRPNFHLKIDTGMNRHGIYPKEVSRAISIIKSNNLPIRGIYTHFASAKDLNYPTYTENQFNKFLKVVSVFEKAGYTDLVKHAAATGGTLVNKKYNLDWVRVGIGLYGLWPSKELEMQLGDKVALKPVLSWHTIISEIKPVKKGEFIGYDLVYRAPRNTSIAVLPIGYWHGLCRSFSGNGSVLIRGKEAPIIGRVSMGVVIVDVLNIPCRVGDDVVVIGRQKRKELSAHDLAQKIGTIHYELVTRLNPL